MLENKKNILVTGGGGYIGSHTCKYLRLSGFNPVVYDNFITGHKKFVKWGDYIEGNIGDKSSFSHALKKYKPISIIHFAGLSNVKESVENPEKYYNENVKSFENMMEIILEMGVKNFIFSSSAAVYNSDSEMPLTEESRLLPSTPYGQNKLEIEKILKDLDLKQKIKYIILRYFNAAGSDLDCEIGELHDPETHLIPNLINSQINNKTAHIYGNDYNTSDGTTVRDYIHVYDLATGHIKALNYLLKNKKSNIFNLGSGRGYSILKIIDVFKNLNLDIEYKFLSRRKGDVSELTADISKAKKILNWLPINSDIKTIILTAYKWHRKINSEK